MKRITVISLIVFLQLFSVNFAFAETKEEKQITKVKTNVQKLGIGPDAKIEVKLKNGSKVKGYVLNSDVEQFVVMDSKTGAALPIPYEQVRQAQGSNRKTGVIVIVSLIVLGALLLYFGGKS